MFNSFKRKRDLSLSVDFQHRNPKRPCVVDEDEDEYSRKGGFNLSNLSFDTLRRRGRKHKLACVHSPSKSKSKSTSKTQELTPTRSPTTNRSTTSESFTGRAILQTVSQVTDIASSAVGMLPMVGSPLKGAMETICKISSSLDQYFQNEEDLLGMKSQIDFMIFNFVGLRDTGIEDLDNLRRYSIKELKNIQNQSNKLHNWRMRTKVTKDSIGRIHQSMRDCVQNYKVLADEHYRSYQLKLQNQAQVSKNLNTIESWKPSINPIGILNPLMSMPKIQVNDMQDNIMTSPTIIMIQVIGNHTSWIDQLVQTKSGFPHIRTLSLPIKCQHEY